VFGRRATRKKNGKVHTVDSFDVVTSAKLKLRRGRCPFPLGEEVIEISGQLQTLSALAPWRRKPVPVH